MRWACLAFLAAAPFLLSSTAATLRTPLPPRVLQEAIFEGDLERLGGQQQGFHKVVARSYETRYRAVQTA